ncbi:MAG: Polysaccharide deacetylase [Caulobacteraceae bacterium]|nr:Polysaccharide deacetylase [Caulobacteraceae bacterium]
MVSRRSFTAGAVSLIAGMGGGLAAARPLLRWPGGARAAVSLTYDDGLDSQIDNAAPDLQAAGFRATFFLTRQNMEDQLPRWQAVWRLGHEVGNHSVTHPCQLRHCTSARFGDEEIAPMEAFLDEHFSPDRFRSYAYPCGFIGLGEGEESQRIARYGRALRGRIAAARTVSGLANDPSRVVSDPLLLHAYQPTYAVDDPRRAFRYVRRTLAAGGWAILVFHDVLGVRKGEGQTSQASHRAILRWLSDQPIWCAPMGEVFQYIQARQSPARPVAGGQPQPRARV